MIPPFSSLTPGINPGTSTNVNSGILKASQKRTNLPALTDASTFKAPAKT